MWPEVKTVLDDNKRELCLTGAEIAKRIEEDGLDMNIFKLININLLRICDAHFKEIPNDLSQLINLQSLILYGNEIVEIPDAIVPLQKLKFLDISRNKLTRVTSDIVKLTHLDTINLSFNELSKPFPINGLTKLTVLNLSYNQLEDFADICNAGLVNLIQLDLKSNKITSIPADVVNLVNLKVLDLSVNSIKEVPKILANVPKLKDIELLDNPIADKRLLKLVKQCRSKQIMDYVKAHGAEIKVIAADSSKVQKDAKKVAAAKTSNEKILHVVRSDSDKFKVVYEESVKTVRPFILCCIIRDFNFTPDTFKRFLQIQCKLHDTVCVRREKSTIATHDLDKIKSQILTYTAKNPADIKIHPLGRSSETTGLELYNSLKSEAELLRKEKKRSIFSAIHKYLYLLENKELLSCLEDAEGNVLSLHPLTNSNSSKITPETKNMLFEVSSSTDMKTCRSTIEALIVETYNLMLNSAGSSNDDGEHKPPKLVIQQVRITDKDGNLKNVFPSKTDLQVEGFTVEIENA